MTLLPHGFWIEFASDSNIATVTAADEEEAAQRAACKVRISASLRPFLKQQMTHMSGLLAHTWSTLSAWLEADLHALEASQGAVYGSDTFARLAALCHISSTLTNAQSAAIHTHVTYNSECIALLWRVLAAHQPLWRSIDYVAKFTRAAAATAQDSSDLCTLSLQSGASSSSSLCADNGAPYLGDMLASFVRSCRTRCAPLAIYRFLRHIECGARAATCTR